jgi:phage terminase large subunit-like protein
MKETLTPHVAAALRYAEGVLDGSLITCSWTKKACERFIDDRAKDKKGKWKYTFDNARAEKFCVGIERLPHVKGEWARHKELIHLQDWQCFIVCNVFGWVDRETRLRRYRTVYVEVARKNGKSALLSAILLLMLTIDGEEGAEVYSAATTRDQARIVWSTARQMALKSPAMVRELGVNVGVHNLSVESTASKCEALSAEANTLDGLNPHFAAVDELHAHPTRKVWDVLETATGSRAQALLWAITTAGTDRTGICYEIRSYLVKILDHVVEDDTFFGVIYTIDDADEWWDRSVWIKANPNLGVSVYQDDLERLARKAEATPSAVPNFLTKRLNVWVNADHAWMDMRALERCADPTLTIERFAGKPCLLSLDLASKRDIAARAQLFEEDGELYAFLRYYLPESAVDSSPNSQYQGWARSGRLQVTEGDVTDFDVIEEELLQAMTEYEVAEVPFDPYQATQLSTHMLEEGLPMIEVGATVRNFSEPMKHFEALVMAGKFHFDGDPVFVWMVSNVVCHVDKKDNIYPNKETEHNKIDGVIAVLMGINRILVNGGIATAGYDGTLRTV